MQCELHALWQSNEELRNTNGCYLVTQFSSNPTNRFILSELSFLAKVTKKTCLRNFTTIFFVLRRPYFGGNLYEGRSLVDFSVEEICGVCGKKFITHCVMCITHCDIYKTHCIMYKTHCVMKKFVGSGDFIQGIHDF